MRLVALCKEEERESSLFSCTKERLCEGPYRSQKESSYLEMNMPSPSSWTSGSKTVRNKSLLFKLPSYGSLLW